MTLRAPFPWFGGKSRAAHLVWQGLGADVPNYCEPFAGSLAVLLGRPGGARGIETANDSDAYLSNFWRSVQADPEAVAHWADWPVSEPDMHARHLWLVYGTPTDDAAVFRERVLTDPDFYDAKRAGWWVWGLCMWIGGGWCRIPKPGTRVERRRRPAMSRGRRGTTGGRKLPLVGGTRGTGVHARGLSRQLPCLDGDSGAAGRGIQASAMTTSIYDWMQDICDRLRKVRVCCGDWRRILGPAVTTCIGTTGVLLDPPYSDKAGRAADIYAKDSLQVAHDVREWALANGDNPKLRIALCGYEGEHEMPDDWTCVAWEAPGGYGSKENARKERIWFSPHCLLVRQQLQLWRTA